MENLKLWTQEQILSQGADAQVGKAARSLTRPAKWQTLAFSEADNAIWGEIKGSGKDPYQVAIALDGPAFKCSCPSHKKPCKHAIGLFLTAQANPTSLKSETPPSWVAEWLQKRQAAAERKVRRETSDSVVDTAAQAKRAARREDLVQQGIDALRLWVGDMLRQGLSELPSQPRSFWETQTARLVDAQAPGLARRLREMAGVPYSGEGWPSRLLDRLGRLHLLLEAYSRLDTLPPDLQEEVRNQIGWPQDQSALLAGPGVRDQWLVLSASEETEERLQVRSTWLWGAETRQAALILDFIAPGQSSRIGGLPVGVALDAELVFFPGMIPQRALLKAQHSAQPISALPGYDSLATAFATTGAALARSPWTERFLWPLEGMTPLQTENEWRIQDPQGHYLPVALADPESWRLLALSGGHPTTMVGEWDLEKFKLLSVWTGRELVALS
ncbi:MAG: SWIM zinc finger family protein [Anaerolineae bacterium]|nr:SWIM zinc finger family protein [Anaerolineae bacterium]